MMDGIVTNLNLQHKAMLKHYRASSYKLQTPMEPQIVESLVDSMQKIVAIGESFEVPLELWIDYCNAIGDFASYVADECSSLQAKAFGLWNDIKEERYVSETRLENLTDGRSFGEPEEVDA